MKKIILICLPLVMMACKKEEVDETKPTISSATVTNGTEELTITATEEVEVSFENTVKFKANFSDDTELSEVKIEVHSASDGHVHERPLAEAVAEGDDHHDDEDEHHDDDDHDHDGAHEDDDHDDHDDDHDDHEDFVLTKVIALTGTEDNVEAELWNASDDMDFEGGDYHIDVTVLDKTGNQTQIIYTIEVEE